VDKSFAETWTKKEKLLGNHVSHENVSTFDSSSSIYLEIGLLLMSAPRTPGHNMAASVIPGKATSVHSIPLMAGSINEV
jgi:hypothetical protein